MQETDFHFDEYFDELCDADRRHAERSIPHSAHAQALK